MSTIQRWRGNKARVAMLNSGRSTAVQNRKAGPKAKKLSHQLGSRKVGG
jgi:hypothetical protein